MMDFHMEIGAIFSGGRSDFLPTRYWISSPYKRRVEMEVARLWGPEI
jgi:hypothetical protein